MTALYRLSRDERSRAVADAFQKALETNSGGRARVTFKEGAFGAQKTVEVFLVGTGWNVAHSGTQEALIVRRPESYYNLDMVPYPWLISIEGIAS